MTGGVKTQEMGVPTLLLVGLLFVAVVWGVFLLGGSIIEIIRTFL
jgi:hypothetical protein